MTAVALLTTTACGLAVWGAGHQNSNSATDESPAATSATPTRPSALPSKVVVGYWQSWGNPVVRLRDVPKEYNGVLVAFAVGDDRGQARFSQSAQSSASFTADVDELSAAGRKVLLSVGGAQDGGLAITTDRQRETFVNSVLPIIDRYHFTGIDWDLEHGFSPAQVAKASHVLKDHYGPDFALTMAPTLSRHGSWTRP